MPVTEGGSVTVAGSYNYPPLLAWSPKACPPQGAEPPRTAINRRVNYFDDDNQCPLNGSPDIRYKFVATDGIDNALGEPGDEGSSIEVINANYAATQDGSHDDVYSFISMSSALNKVGSQQDETILVHKGTYPEKLYITQDQITIASACGSKETIVQHSNNPVVYIYRSVNAILDKTTVTGGSGRGVFSKSTTYAGISSPIIRKQLFTEQADDGK